MSIFGNLTSQGLEESQDRLGGFQPLETDIYHGIIKALYAGQAASGARSVTLIADLGGKEYRETLYITNKNGENFFLNKHDKTKKVGLPGFIIVDDICLIATGNPLSEQETEDKVINVYNPETKKDEPKAVPMIIGAIGKPIALGIVRQTVNKNEKQGDEYVATAETRDENIIDKVYHPELKLTVSEARNGQTEAKFYDLWLERNKGVTRDRREIKDGSAGAPGAKPGAPTAGGAAAAAAPRKSLFGNK